MSELAAHTDYRIGCDLVERLVLMENHDQALYTWREGGAKRRILVHIDAHHDMWWVKDKALVTIANFISPALREDLVREVYWVVPDASFDMPRDRKHILKHLKKIGKQYSRCATGVPPVPGHGQDGRGTSGQVPHGTSGQVAGATGVPPVPGHGQDGRGTTNATSEITRSVLGKTLHVCRLASLPHFDEPVLLDIDVDYLLIPRVTYGETDEHGPLPWLWPEELLRRLAEREVRSDLATVVYSVEGGYTPLRWKYLGDELALRLKQPAGDAPQIEGYRLMREAAEAAVRGEQDAAEAKYQQAARLLPASAAPSYHLAHLLLKMGRREEARRTYRQALERDPSYRTAYSGPGLVNLWDQRLREAEREFQITLDLDPDDATAHYGLADVAARRKRWAEAETLLRKSLAETPVDSHRLLGKVLAKQGRRDEAIAAYERSLKLALTGHKPLAAPLLTATGEQRLLDPFISQTQERLGHLYAKQGKISEAINSLRMSTGGGYDRVGLRARLAGLYLRQSKWKPACVETWHAVKMIPLEIKWVCQRNYQRVRRFMSRG